MDKGMDILTNNGMGEIAGIGSDIYNVSQSGNSNDWGGLAARTLEKIYSHKDDHLKDANGNIIDNSTTDNSTTNNGPCPPPTRTCWTPATPPWRTCSS
jgi:hypothetical protein